MTAPPSPVTHSMERRSMMRRSFLPPLGPSSRYSDQDRFHNTDSNEDIDYKSKYQYDPNDVDFIHGRFGMYSQESSDKMLIQLGVTFITSADRPPLTTNEANETVYRPPLTINNENEVDVALPPVYRRTLTPDDKDALAVAVVLETVAETIKLPQKDLTSLLCLNRTISHKLISNRSLWLSLDFQWMNKAGDRLISALSLRRYFNPSHINLAFAKDITDNHFQLLTTKEKVVGSLRFLKSLNLDGCKNISTKGFKNLTRTCPRLQKFSICGNSRLTDFWIKTLVKKCEHVTDLKFKCCEKITDKSLVTIGNSYHQLESLDITGCKKVTDVGVVAIAEGCQCLQFLSLCELPLLTYRCLETLSKTCSNTLTTLRVDHCTGIELTCKIWFAAFLSCNAEVLNCLVSVSSLKTTCSSSTSLQHREPETISFEPFKIAAKSESLDQNNQQEQGKSSENSE